MCTRTSSVNCVISTAHCVYVSYFEFLASAGTGVYGTHLCRRNMPPRAPKNSPSLGIRLDQETYAPGGTITGHIYRQRPIVSPFVRVVCSLQGFTSAGRVRNYGDNAFSLFAGNWCEPDIFRCPLHIEAGDEERWSFSLRIPLFVDDNRNPGGYGPSSIPAGERHQLLPTYVLRTAATGDGPLKSAYRRLQDEAFGTSKQSREQETSCRIQRYEIVAIKQD